LEGIHVDEQTQLRKFWEALKDYMDALDPNHPDSGALSTSELSMLLDEFFDKAKEIFGPQPDEEPAELTAIDTAASNLEALLTGPQHRDLWAYTFRSAQLQLAIARFLTTWARHAAK
jgi:hypothetical protein